jgi:2-keto-4-pentenoate hydratase/2-oxohepta-3-ene-1,7-dioic acid hydratase in catechol pathway
VFSVPRLIAELSAILPLLPGDVIFTGTPAGGGGTRKPPRFLQPGEVLHSRIEGIGDLRNTFVSQ